MRNLIHKIYGILNACKGFEVGYSSDTASDGYFYIEYGEGLMPRRLQRCR